MRPALRSLIICSTALCALLVGGLAAPVGAEAARSDAVRFTRGPGTGAPPDAIGGIPVTPFSPDGRELDAEVSTIGPLTVAPAPVHYRVGDGWDTWSHGYTGDVYVTDGLTLTLPAHTSAISFYAEPDDFATIKIRATTNDGTTSSNLSVRGEGGARYFGFYTTRLTTSIKTITVSSRSTFAIGELAISGENVAYAALGDSYSSGEGGGSPTPATDTDTDRCHRDTAAYPVRISERDPAYRPLGFVACSGSATYDLTHANHLFGSEGPQLDVLSSLTTTVTLTIGGNDVGFASVLDTCIAAAGRADGRGCSTRSAFTADVDSRIAALRGKGSAITPEKLPITPLAEVLAQIHARAPRARIYLAAYPELFGNERRTFEADPTAPSGYACRLNPLVGASLDYADTQWFNSRTRKLNSAAKAAVKKAEAADGSLRATYVKVGRFSGHGLCDDAKAWINPLLLSVQPGQLPTPSAASFHPTAEGQRKGYYKTFVAYGL